MFSQVTEAGWSEYVHTDIESTRVQSGQRSREVRIDTYIESTRVQSGQRSREVRIHTYIESARVQSGH